jgi:hypothetical protein
LPTNNIPNYAIPFQSKFTDSYSYAAVESLEKGLHTRFDEILCYETSKFDAHYLISALLDVNEGWTLPEPPDVLAKLLYAMVYAK